MNDTKHTPTIRTQKERSGDIYAAKVDELQEHIDTLSAALSDLLEFTEHIPPMLAFQASGKRGAKVTDIRRAGKYIAARENARAALAKVNGSTVTA